MSIYSLCLLALMKSLCWNNINSGADGSSASIPQHRPYSGQPQPAFSFPAPPSSHSCPHGQPPNPALPRELGMGTQPSIAPTS